MSHDDSHGRLTAPGTGAEGTGRASACALCGRPSGAERVVQTTQGGLVHVACADQFALRAWRRRRQAALGHALVATLTLLALAYWAEASLALLAVTLAWAGLHGILHRRYWHYTLRDLRRRRRRR